MMPLLLGFLFHKLADFQECGTVGRAIVPTPNLGEGFSHSRPSPFAPAAAAMRPARMA